MNFLAIDTSGKHLSVVASGEGGTERVFFPDCALRHSVCLMDAIDEALSRARLRPADCDFFAAVVGPGSFTGIRIGIATAKGLALAAGKPTRSVTSFDCIAYAVKDVFPLLAVTDAGHGQRYAQKFTCAGAEEPRFYTAEEFEKVRTGCICASTEALFEGCLAVDPCEGLERACLSGNAKEGELRALYLRRSAAEEGR